jgi:hypothetical protein
MTTYVKKDDIRLKVFNRTLQKNFEKDPEKYKILQEILSLSDEEKIAILNAAVLPNAYDMNNFQYSLFFQLMLKNDGRTQKRIKNFIKKVLLINETASITERRLIKYGYLNGFESKDPLTNYQNFINLTFDGEESKKPKHLTFYFFKKIFNFIYKLITKGEINDKFPR